MSRICIYNSRGVLVGIGNLLSMCEGLVIKVLLEYMYLEVEFF